jgi:malate synthase
VLLDDGEPFTPERYEAIRNEELARLGGAGEGRLAEATDLLDRLVLDDDFAEFLTLRAYAILE